MKSSVMRWLLALAVGVLVSAASAEAPLVVGKDYAVISPALQVDNPAKTELIEFFSYACPHCSELNPSLMKWADRLPTDVTFKRVPVSFNPFYQLMAKLYYTLEAIGELSRLDSAVFDAIHNKGLRLVDEKSIRDWVVAQGVDAKRFSDAFNSFGVDSKVKQANFLAQTAKIPGVPTLVVDGKYVVLGENARGFDGMLAVAGRVVDKARGEHAKK